MIKIIESNSESSCWNKAKTDEMIFVLLERDAAAPVAIEAWIAERLRLGKNDPEDDQIQEAQSCANYMREACEGKARGIS